LFDERQLVVLLLGKIVQRAIAQVSSLSPVCLMNMEHKLRREVQILGLS
jgi:hypothetical protein